MEERGKEGGRNNKELWQPGRLNVSGMDSPLRIVTAWEESHRNGARWNRMYVLIYAVLEARAHNSRVGGAEHIMA